MGTYRSLMVSFRGRDFLEATGYLERCASCGMRWGPEIGRRYLPADHGENGPYAIVRSDGTVVGTSDKLVDWVNGEPSPLATRGAGR